MEVARPFAWGEAWLVPLWLCELGHLPQFPYLEEVDNNCTYMVCVGGQGYCKE